MNEEEKSTPFEFVGGSADGYTISVVGDVLPFEEWSPPTAPDDGKREIYKLHDDGKFHFDRYGLTYRTAPITREMVDDLKAVYKKISTVINELDAVAEKHGGPDASPVTIGNWVIKHKDA